MLGWFCIRLNYAGVAVCWHDPAWGWLGAGVAMRWSDFALGCMAFSWEAISTCSGSVEQRDRSIWLIYYYYHAAEIWISILLGN